jgi:hypothetical protein
VIGCRIGAIDCIAGRIPLAVPQATEWERIGNQIDTAISEPIHIDIVAVVERHKPLNRPESGIGRFSPELHLVSDLRSTASTSGEEKIT